MRVFKMNDCDHVCASSEEEAKTFYKNETGFDQDEIDTDFEGEVSLSTRMYIPVNDLPEKEMSMTQLDIREWGGELHVQRPFEWVIERYEITKPCVICSTEW